MRTTVNDAIEAIESKFPVELQDSWDNSGLIIGDKSQTLTGILLTVDITLDTIKEAAAKGCNLVISHHPILFRGLRKITNSSDEERIVAAAIRNNIAIYAAHTSADKSPHGTSARLAQLIGLNVEEALVPEQKSLYKIATFVPTSHADIVREALFSAGAGHIGNYSHCSFNAEGGGTFLAHDETKPFVGTKGELHFEKEVKMETIVARNNLNKAIKSLITAHPYEEPAYDIYQLENQWTTCGYGVVGQFEKALAPTEFLELLKKRFNCGVIRHNEYNHPITKVAICTGSGSEFISNAQRKGADAYITADIKYHQFAQPEGTMMIADIGHYESEELTKQLFLDILTEKLSKFAPCLSDTCSNPIKYY